MQSNFRIQQQLIFCNSFHNCYLSVSPKEKLQNQKRGKFLVITNLGTKGWRRGDFTLNMDM
jgi:hypothetical protein